MQMTLTWVTPAQFDLGPRHARWQWIEFRDRLILVQSQLGGLVIEITLDLSRKKCPLPSLPSSF